MNQSGDGGSQAEVLRDTVKDAPTDLGADLLSDLPESSALEVLEFLVDEAAELSEMLEPKKNTAADDR